MPLLKDFTDASGNDYSPAYFRVAQLNIGAADEQINLVFYAYKDADSFASGKQPLPGGVKQYRINGSDFASVASAAPVGSTLFDILAHASESYALGKLDTLNGENVFVSFFDGASQS